MNQLRYPLSFVLLALLPVLAACPLDAEERTFTYEKALELALGNSPRMKQIDAAARMARAEGIALETVPNPELSADVRPYVADADGRDIEYEVSLAQPLKPSFFGARTRVAALLRRTGDVQSKIDVLEFSQSLLLTYTKAWALQEKVQYLRKLSRRLETLNSKIASSGQAGAIAESTRQTLKSEQIKFQIEHEGVVADLGRAQAELLQKMGTSAESMPLDAPQLASLPEKLDSGFDNKFVERRLRLRADLAREQHRLARLDAFPRFAPRIGFEHTADGDDRLLLGFSVDLPLSDRNQSEILKAHAAKEAVDAELRYLTSGNLGRELQLVLDSARAAARSAKRAKADLLPALERAYTAAEKEVFAGQASPLQLWQLLKELSESHDRSLELWIKAISHQVELAIMTGEES